MHCKGYYNFRQKLIFFLHHYCHATCDTFILHVSVCFAIVRTKGLSTPRATKWCNYSNSRCFVEIDCNCYCCFGYVITQRFPRSLPGIIWNGLAHNQHLHLLNPQHKSATKHAYAKWVTEPEWQARLSNCCWLYYIAMLVCNQWLHRFGGILVAFVIIRLTGFPAC